MEYYLPAPVALILFAALISGATATISFALARRKAAAAAAAAVVEQDANAELMKQHT